MTELLLIRHGETEYNREGRFLGTKDLELNSTGREQAQNLSIKLKDEKIDHTFSSDLSRCRETAEIIGFGNEIIYTENLREMNFGRWEGFTWNEINNRFEKEYKDWMEDWVNYKITDGESFSEMNRKVIEEIEIILKSDYEKAAVVTHGGCIRGILGHYIMDRIESSWRFQIDNGTIARICFSSDYIHLKSLNEK